MDYSKLSDFEINKLVADKIDFGDMIISTNNHEETIYLLEKDGLYDLLPVAHFNPCNNPANAWPIILENKITVDPIGEAWQHRPHPQDYYYHEGICNNVSDKNPLRAAMITFLKMNE